MKIFLAAEAPAGVCPYREVNFYKHHSGGKPNGAWVVGTEAGGREGRREERFSAVAYNQSFHL